MREIRQREAGVGRRKLLVRDHRGDRIQARAAEALLDGDPEKTELAELAKELDVEPLFVVRRLGLGVDFSFGERTDELAKRAMLRRRIEEVSHPAGLT